MKKICVRCKEEKDLSEFYTDTRNKDGKRGYCRTCAAAEFLAYSNSPKGKAKIKNRLLIKKYGINHEEYNKMFAAQKGCCAICGRHQVEFDRALSVDHDHETSKVRGLLCMNCNVVLGNVYDNPELLRLAADYLEAHIDPA